jgi:hypothetical protein
MNTVKIYEVNCYEAPLIDGFHAGICNDGEQVIFDKNGNYHQLFTYNDWLFPRPAISIDEPPYSIILEPRPNVFGIPIDGKETC